MSTLDHSIFAALERRDLTALSDLLRITSANVLEKDISPLMYASYWGLFDIIDALLSTYTITSA